MDMKKYLELKHLAHLAFGTAAIVIAVLGWVLYDASVQSRESTHWVDHTLDIIQAIDDVKGGLSHV